MKPWLARFVGPMLAVALVAAAIVLTLHKSDGSGDPSVPSPDEPSSVPPSSGSRPAQLTDDKAQLNKRVKAFSRLYFSLSPTRSPENIKEAVTPYASAHFLNTAVFGFSSSVADQAMLEEGASLEVTAVSDLIGEYLDARTVAGSVTLHVTKLDHDGNVITSFEHQQEMTWVKQDNTWLIYATPRT
jgi:hypothetical protein